MDLKIGLKALRGFHAIVRTGSATAAGREMELSQSAVSRLLAQLEQTIGFELFYRDRGRLVLTADGLRFYEEVDLALGNFERVFSLARDIAGLRIGELKLVAPPSFSEGVLPDIVSAFLERFPNIHLTIDSRSVETSKSMIANRAVDGGFVKLPLERPDLRPEKVVSSESVCVMARDHPLAAHKTLDPPLLRVEPLILLGLGRSSRAQIEAAFAEHKVTPNVRIETHTVGSACALAGRGLGIAIVNQLLARSYVRGNIVMRGFRPRLVHEYAFVTSALSAPTRIADAFRKHATEYFAKLEGAV
jgi:DNA-binding transcriptional LysR family regulator